MFVNSPDIIVNLYEFLKNSTKEKNMSNQQFHPHESEYPAQNRDSGTTHPQHKEGQSTTVPPQQTQSDKLAKPKNKVITHFILNLLYISLIASALIGIGAILFGNDEYGGNAFATVALLILVDILLIVGLFIKIPSFRYTIWGMTVLSFIFSVLGIWVTKTPEFYDPSVGFENEYDYEYYSSVPKELSEYFSDIGAALWLLTITIVLLSIVSLAQPLINKLGKGMVALYWSLNFIAIAGTIPLSISIAASTRTNMEHIMPLKIYLSTFMLSATIVVILGIAMIYQAIVNSQAKSAAYRENYRKIQEQEMQRQSNYRMSNNSNVNPKSNQNNYPPSHQE